MISGATRVSAGRASAKHVGSHLAKETGQVSTLLPGRGVSGTTIHAQVRLLAALASDLPSQEPLLHVHLDPAVGENRPEVLAAWWRAFETEFGLGRARYCAVQHAKAQDRRDTHEHRVYERRNDRGRVANVSHDYLRRQRITVEVCHQYGLACPPLAHAKAVVAELERRGRADLVEFVRAAGELDRNRRVAPITPRERMAETRTGITKREIGAAVLSAWQTSDSGASLAAALADRRLVLAQGDRGVAVVLDPSGTAHPLARLLGAASKATTGQRISAAAVHARLAGLSLPPAEQARLMAKRPAAPITKVPKAPQDAPKAPIPKVIPPTPPRPAPAAVEARPATRRAAARAAAYAAGRVAPPATAAEAEARLSRLLEAMAAATQQQNRPPRFAGRPRPVPPTSGTVRHRTPHTALDQAAPARPQTRAQAASREAQRQQIADTLQAGCVRGWDRLAGEIVSLRAQLHRGGQRQPKVTYTPLTEEAAWRRVLDVQLGAYLRRQRHLVANWEATDGWTAHLEEARQRRATLAATDALGGALAPLWRLMRIIRIVRLDRQIARAEGALASLQGERDRSTDHLRHHPRGRQLIEATMTNAPRLLAELAALRAAVAQMAPVAAQPAASRPAASGATHTGRPVGPTPDLRRRPDDDEPPPVPPRPR